MLDPTGDRSHLAVTGEQSPVGSPDLPLVKQIDAKNSIFISRRNCRPLRIDRNFNSDRLGVGIVQCAGVSKHYVVCYPLLKRHGGAGQLRPSSERWTDS